MSFLRAEWRKLAIANYAVEPAVLSQYLPAGTQLDLWEGTCYVSLVGFMFLNTRVMGMRIPGHTHFEEVNLRFYVKRLVNGEVRRGVVFIKEIVPRAAITFVANTLYKEHYQTLPMRHHWEETAGLRSVRYEWKAGGQWQQFSLEADIDPQTISAGSAVEFITEHYWGYARIDDRNTNEYEVRHPRWQHYPVQKHRIQVDFAATYGPAFGFLNDQKPASVMLAEGSEISVEGKKRLRVGKNESVQE